MLVLAAASIIALAIIGPLDQSMRIECRGAIIEVAFAAKMSVVTTSSCAVDGSPSTVGICTLRRAPNEEMRTLFDDVRADENMFSAWRHVKRSALNSENDDIRGKASEFEYQHQRHIKRIQTQLREGRFRFDQVEGVLKDKKIRAAAGKDPRPIAIGTIKNRLVQRAILQVLQPRKVADTSIPNSQFSPLFDPRS